MPNIAILNYCNLQCPYCFANKFITEEEKELITLDQLHTIFDFLRKSNVPEIRLIGGEPTIHPQFEEILKESINYCKDFHSMPLIFSNGIKLGNFAKLMLNCRALINVNSPETVGNAKWEEFEKSLKKLKNVGAIDNINFGVNLYPSAPNYDYIFKLLKQYNKDHVRCSYVAPTCKFEKSNKDLYYENAKPLFLDFIRQAETNHIEVGLDCNTIPKCYFTDEELELVNKVTAGYHSFCDPVIDISPDMKATACFGAYNLVDITQFNDLHEVERYLLFNEMYTRVLKNNIGKCKNCDKFTNRSCQGGCLAFAN